MSKISLCVITHNCADYILRFLDSFKGTFDELCLVRGIGAADPDQTVDLARDWCAANGKEFRFAEYKNQIRISPINTDGKPEIISENPCNPCLWPHVDNFAAARQMSFDLASNDFILWADTDDVFEGDPDLVRQLPRLHPGYPAFIIPYKIFARGITVNRVRMMLRGSGRWHFPVHEDYRFPLEPVTAVQEDRCAVVHLPKFDGSKDSNPRNLRILESIPQSEITTGLLYHLHTELIVAGRIPDAIEAAKQALTRPDIGRPEKYEMFLNFAQVTTDPDAKAAFLHQAYAADPRRREALGLLANHALNFGQPDMGLAYARQMIATPEPEQTEWNSRRAVYSWVGDDLHAQALRANGHPIEADKIRRAALNRAGGARISLIHATRGRPEKASLARKLWLDMAERPEQVEHIFVIDDDDRASDPLRRMHHLCLPAGGGCVAAWNHGAFASEGNVIVQLSDDWTPPPKWDQLIYQRLAAGSDDFDKPAVLAISDGLRDDDLLCMAICTRGYWLLDYFLFHPWFKGVYSDNWFTELAYARGAVIDARDLVFQHNHPIRDNPCNPCLDQTYAAQNSPQRYHEGKAVLEYLRTGADWSSVPGWFNFWPFYEMIARQLKDGDTVAEIGVWFGRSLICLAQTCQRLGKDVQFIAVDTFKGEQDQPDHQAIVNQHGGSIRAVFESNLVRCGVSASCAVIEGQSASSARNVADGSLAFAFIDAAHDYASVKADIAAWLPKIKPGGILAGHDYQHEPVRRAVADALGKVQTMQSVWFSKVN